MSEAGRELGRALGIYHPGERGRWEAALGRGRSAAVFSSVSANPTGSPETGRPFRIFPYGDRWAGPSPLSPITGHR